MPLKTTTIGAYPKPECTPVRDWFLAHMSEDERKATPGLLRNWAPGEYERALESAGDKAETLFLEATKQIIDDQVGAGVDIPTDGEVRRENYIFYQCRRLGGISFDTITHRSVRQGAFEADLPTIVGPISLTATRLAEDWKAAQQFTDNPVKITIPGPLTISDSIATIITMTRKRLPPLWPTRSMERSRPSPMPAAVISRSTSRSLHASQKKRWTMASTIWNVPSTASRMT